MESNSQPTRTTGHRRRSEIWDHFQKKAECKYYNALLCADSVKDGTSRLRRHYEETCPVRHPRPVPASKPGSHSASVLQANRNLKNAPGISNSVPDNSSQQMVAAAKDQLLKMIAVHGFPSLLVEDIEFNRFVRMLCSDFQMPSREDVEERCDALFDQEMSSLKDALGRTSGLVSLSVGRAQTASMVEVMFLVAHFIDDEWNLCRRVLRVFKVTHESDEPTYDNILNIKDHCVSWGHYDEVVGTTASWGLLPKLTGAILDEIFSSKFRNILYQNNHLEHLSETQHKVFRAIDIHWQLDLVARMLTAHSADPYSDIPYGEHCLHAFVKLCLTKKELRDTSSCLQLNHPWTYNRWWYALYYALQILHTKCSSGAEEIAGLVGNATFQETDTTELIRTTLDAVYKAIETVAASNSPTSNLSLIELVKLKRKLDSGCSIAPRTNCEDNNEEQTDDEETSEEQTDDNDDYDARPAFEETKRYLHELIEKSYLSQSIPLILDPRFKLVHVKRLLKKASLSSSHISEVQAVVRRLFRDYSNQGNATGNTNRGNENEMDIDIFHKMYQMSGSTWQNFDQSGMELDHRSSMESGTELDTYLQEKTVSIKEENFDILKWWKENCHMYPTVSRMARDFLAIPTSTRPTPQLMTEITNHLRRYA